MSSHPVMRNIVFVLFENATHKISPNASGGNKTYTESDNQ